MHKNRKLKRLAAKGRPTSDDLLLCRASLVGCFSTPGALVWLVPVQDN